MIRPWSSPTSGAHPPQTSRYVALNEAAAVVSLVGREAIYATVVSSAAARSATTVRPLAPLPPVPAGARSERTSPTQAAMVTMADAALLFPVDLSARRCAAAVRYPPLVGKLLLSVPRGSPPVQPVRTPTASGCGAAAPPLLSAWSRPLPLDQPFTPIVARHRTRPRRRSLPAHVPHQGRHGNDGRRCFPTPRRSERSTLRGSRAVSAAGRHVPPLRPERLACRAAGSFPHRLGGAESPRRPRSLPSSSAVAQSAAAFTHTHPPCVALQPPAAPFRQLHARRSYFI